MAELAACLLPDLLNWPVLGAPEKFKNNRQHQNYQAMINLGGRRNVTRLLRNLRLAKYPRNDCRCPTNVTPFFAHVIDAALYKGSISLNKDLQPIFASLVHLSFGIPRLTEEIEICVGRGRCWNHMLLNRGMTNTVAAIVSRLVGIVIFTFPSEASPQEHRQCCQRLHRWSSS